MDDFLENYYNILENENMSLKNVYSCYKGYAGIIKVHDVTISNVWRNIILV